MKYCTVLLACLAFASQSAWADSRAVRVSTLSPANKCAPELERCFSKTGLARSDCFLEVTEKSACKNTPLGNLAYKRWVFSAVQTPGESAPPALLGPGLVDGECVANFDNQWLSDIVREDYSKVTIGSLDRRLESCKQDSSQQLLQP